jgi:hypothetical protein
LIAVEGIDMALNRPIKTLPSTDAVGQPVDISVSVVPMTLALAALWSRYVQPLVDANYQHDEPGALRQNVRADVGWNWNRILWLALGHTTTAPVTLSGRALAMSIVVKPSNAPAFPIGMLTAVPQLMCNVFANTRHRGFVWYLSDAPAEAYRQILKTRPIKGVAPALIDCSIQATLDLTGDAAHLLHADPAGGDKLIDFYNDRCKMIRLPASHGPITPFFRRRNADEYFYFDHAGAAAYSAAYDLRR